MSLHVSFIVIVVQIIRVKVMNVNSWLSCKNIAITTLLLQRAYKSSLRIMKNYKQIFAEQNEINHSLISLTAIL